MFEKYGKKKINFNEKKEVKRKTQRLPTTIKLPQVKPIQQSKYQLSKMIGQGSFGKVRLSLNRENKQSYVIKIYNKNHLNTNRYKAVQKQIQLLNLVNHTRIIRIHEIVQTKDQIWIVMEYFSQISLEKYVRSKRPIKQHVLHKIALQITQALQYLHGLQIAHRDLKPENILINHAGDIKIIDLGLSTIVNNLSEINLVGTPQYMCPELIDGKKYDPFKADVWALGVMLYWIYLGYFPQICKKKNNLMFPIDIHPGVEYLIKQMLNPQPQERISVKQILMNTWITPLNLLAEIAKRSLKILNNNQNQVQNLKQNQFTQPSKTKQQKL